MSPIALDSSSLIRYLNGRGGSDTAAVRDMLAAGRAVVPPLVVSEVLSLPELPEEVAELVCGLAQLAITAGYWERIGALRASVLGGGQRARMADTLIAQSCIDHGVPLITAGADFRHFVPHGLRLHP